MPSSNRSNMDQHHQHLRGPASPLNIHQHHSVKSKNGNNWWKRRTGLERRLSLCIGLMVCVTIGLAVALMAVIFQAHNDLKSSTESDHEVLDGEHWAMDNVCHTPGCVIAAAELMKFVDQKVDPCEDFYAFACGSFEKNTIIPDDESSVDTFSLLSDELTKKLRILIENSIEKEEAYPFKLVKKLYQSCLNKTHAEEKGTSPLDEILNQLGGWPAVVGDKWNQDEFVWYEKAYQFRRLGYSTDYLFSFSVTSDQKNSTRRVIDLDEGSLGMPGREYLLNGIEDKDVTAYLEYQIGLAVLLGANPERARKEQTAVVEFEIQLAEMSLPREERRDATKFYNPMTIKELKIRFPDIPWMDYMNMLLAPHHVLKENERVIVNVLDFFPKLVALLNKTPKRTIANYLMWRVAKDSVSYLNDAARNLQLKYSAVLSGTTERKPRWEECTDLVSWNLGNAVGAMYVREHFKDAARQAVNEMVKDIQNVFNEIIDELDWMDDGTRKRAKEKAASMTSHIAYPDELLDDKKLSEFFQNLTLDDTDFLKNMLALDFFDTDYYYKKFREPVNKTDWITHGHPAVVNAFYSSSENSIQFPAGILQGAFFGKDRPMYLNYAAIGWIIGHEITHGFDDQGRQYGPDGNLDDWWAPQTKENYVRKAQCIIDQYSNYSFPEVGLNINGINTQGENIADNGGIKEAYLAYIKWAKRQMGKNPSTQQITHWDHIEPRLPGLQKYSVRQLFWIGAANVWCEKTRPESLKLGIMTGQHSPSRFRVSGPFANMPQFTHDFGCRSGQPMNPVSKCAVW